MIIAAAEAKRLAQTTLYSIFGEHDSAKRLETIKATFTSNFIHHELGDTTVEGHEAVNDFIEKLLSGDKASWFFEMTGPVQQNSHLLLYQWKFGPRNDDGGIDSKATGTDILQVEGDKVCKLWILMDGLSDVKG